MGVAFAMFNFTKREVVRLAHLPGNTAREIAGDPATAAVVAWYMLRNGGDHISMIGDDELSGFGGVWRYPVPREELATYPDRTGAVVQELIDHGVLEDRGFLWRDEHEPDRWYVRDLRNVWHDPDELPP